MIQNEVRTVRDDDTLRCYVEIAGLDVEVACLPDDHEEFLFEVPAYQEIFAGAGFTPDSARGADRSASMAALRQSW